MDTVPVVRPPSVTGSAQNTTVSSPRLQPVTVAMDESDGNGVSPSSMDSAVRQSKSGQFLLPSQPNVGFQPTAYASASCHVISQQPFSDVMSVSGGAVPVPSVPVSVPGYAVRQLVPSQPLVQPHVYYRPADGFCVTSSALGDTHYTSEHS